MDQKVGGYLLLAVLLFVLIVAYEALPEARGVLIFVTIVALAVTKRR